jgi:prepilin-type processing-associated H-X9-DG protein
LLPFIEQKGLADQIAGLNASSQHPNRVNSVFADGSIHFINQNIDTGDKTAKPPQAGQGSPDGAWGALGSIDGGEQNGEY